MAEETRFFNADRAKSYDERIPKHIPGYDVLHGISETILASELPEKAAVLVAGVGTGAEILTCAPKHPGWTFMGTDLSEPMLESAKQKLSTAGLDNRVQLKLTTVRNLPEDVLYDAATAHLVLHFVADNGSKEEMMSSLAHHLKAGAPVLVSTMFGDPETTRHKRMVGFTKAHTLANGVEPKEVEEIYSPDRKDLFVVPEERIKALFRYAGFIDVQRVYQALTIGCWLARNPR